MHTTRDRRTQSPALEKIQGATLGDARRSHPYTYLPSYLPTYLPAYMPTYMHKNTYTCIPRANGARSALHQERYTGGVRRC